MAKKQDLANLDPDIANDPATLHTVLSKLPAFSVENTTPYSSQPNSPRMQATQMNGHSRNSSMTSDPDKDVPVIVHSSPALTSIRSAPRSRKSAGQPPLPLDALFTTALQLYDRFPLAHPDISANTIFGPLSAIFTWEKTDLSDEEAEQIVAEGTDVIIPEPIAEETKEEQDEAEAVKDDAEVSKRRRQLQKRLYISKLLLHRSTTIFALVGLAGLLVAMYTGENSVLALGMTSWMRHHWIFRWTLGKL